MQSGEARRAVFAANRSVVRFVLAFAAAALLAACQTDGHPTATLAGTRGPSIAFDSIDGPPPEVFSKLVAELNSEAQSRRLAVVSRDSRSAYRVRGYLAASVEGGRTAIAWTWDVFDAQEQRVTRITGAQSRPGKRKAIEAWAAADADMLKKIAASSLDQLAVFLDATPPEQPQQAATEVARQDGAYTPEAAGIFRIFQAKADPVAAETAATAALENSPVPLPPRRPAVPHERLATLGATAR